MRYEGTVYRPPSEAHSLLIQATIGCPHNKCTFCTMYKDTRFRLRPVHEIKEDLDMARDYYGEGIHSLFFPDGNTIIMKTDQLEEIFLYARQLFPKLQRITVYGSARFVNKKSLEDLQRLKAAGLTRVHTGMESGDDVTLEKIKKGVTSAEIIEAGLKLKQAGIQTSEYYLVGIGGLERTREHALESARVLSAISPDFIRLRTFVPVPNTPLYEDYRQGRFQLLSPHQALQEVRLLVENLECDNSILLSDHVSNYWDVQGIIPRDRQEMLAQIDYALQIDESRFRPPEISRL
ncbi:MAG: radical SAM protein [Syntrophomonadaceae bacterium]|nr:radical SAM protein [Bacillota bacterium]NLM88708.1 radical SAM protein [Syntrophomonadaceae bacterium]HAA09025.1 radical SAM protein [Syntrophomonas sp.]HQA49134.1 radical SAM protein [Syntrophomonadaceae bacterium]HQD89495.1 radical SAM protein [Syntrophomonadaceae bacterium]